MNGQAVCLCAYMDGATKRFIIPIYQRNYDWKIANCKQLFDDLEKVIKQNRKSHFFGSIVTTVDQNNSTSDLLVIDGQQRLTTVSLLMLAICHLIDEGYKHPENNMLRDMIYESYLVNKFQPKEKRLKLKPVKDDASAYSILYNNQIKNNKESSLTANYDYFRQRILNTSLSIDELYEAISRLTIIDISLNEGDDPQLIFESLNSTGLNLNEGDKIRNYVLMGLSKDKQDDYYNDYWNQIEINTDYKVDDFIRDFLSMRRLRIPNIGQVYPEFKEYIEELQINDIKPVLVELKQYSERYKRLIHGRANDQGLNGSIYRLNKLGISVARPFLLEILRLLDEGVLTIDDTTEVFRIIEAYAFRRIICDVPTNALNKIFVTLHNEIMKYDGTPNSYVDKMKYSLSRKHESGRFPSDEEFRDCMSNKNIFGMQSKNKKYYLERMENQGTIETKDIWNHIENGDYSIEHIMPQSLSNEWRKDLKSDGDPDEIHEYWLHKAANLTLTAYNSSFSNNRFVIKRDMENGFKKSGLRMNIWIAQQDKWGVEELEIRNQMILDQSVNIWPYPMTDYEPEVKQDESVTLDSDYELKGMYITKYSFRGSEDSVSSWVDMLQGVLVSLHNDNPAILRNLAYSSKQEQVYSSFAANKDAFQNYRKIDEDVYVFTGTNTESKVNLLKSVFALFGEDEGNLMFYIKKPDDIDDDYAVGRYKQRKEFWSYVLPYLKEQFGENGPYGNTSPTKDNWLTGFLGIGGLSLYCIITYDSARVEYKIAFRNENKVKELFDKLYSNKNTLEQKYGKPLVWDRGDNKKSSKLYSELDDVSLNNKEDWESIKDFMVRNTDLMYKVIHEYAAQFI